MIDLGRRRNSTAAFRRFTWDLSKAPASVKRESDTRQRAGAGVSEQAQALVVVGDELAGAFRAGMAVTVIAFASAPSGFGELVGPVAGILCGGVGPRVARA